MLFEIQQNVSYQIEIDKHTFTTTRKQVFWIKLFLKVIAHL